MKTHNPVESMATEKSLPSPRWLEVKEIWIGVGINQSGVAYMINVVQSVLRIIGH